MLALGLLLFAAGLFGLAAAGFVASIACYAIGVVLDVVGFLRSREFAAVLADADPEPPADPDPGEREPAPGVVVSLDEFRARRVPRSPPALDETASA